MVRPGYWRRIGTYRSLALRGRAVLGDLVERGVLLGGVDPVLELDHAELGEAVAQPAVAGVEQAELLAVRHDPREQHRLEDRAVVRLLHRLDRFLHVDAHALPRLLLEEAVAHADGGFERELLALADLGVAEALVVLLEREHTERDVARFVAHHVAEQLLQQLLGGHLVQEAERREREALDHDLHAEVGHVPAGVGDDVVEQHLEVRVDRVVTRQLGVEVARRTPRRDGLRPSPASPRSTWRRSTARSRRSARCRSSAPCSPCMNCDSVQFCDSIPNWIHSLSPQPLNGVSDQSRSRLNPFWFWFSRDTFSWSTSISHGRSLAFHCDFFAFS